MLFDFIRRCDIRSTTTPLGACRMVRFAWILKARAFQTRPPGRNQQNQSHARHDLTIDSVVFEASHAKVVAARHSFRACDASRVFILRRAVNSASLPIASVVESKLLLHLAGRPCAMQALGGPTPPRTSTNVPRAAPGEGGTNAPPPLPRCAHRSPKPSRHAVPGARAVEQSRDNG